MERPGAAGKTATEVDVLRIELEASQRQVEGKDEALKILQGMAVFDKATNHTKVMLQKAEEERRALEKEINTLQWEIEFEHNRIKNLEESWKEKYDRIHCESMVLKETVEMRTNEVKTLKCENTILNQQWLEILALLDVKQQCMFQENMSFNKSALTETTALEMAVLGACNCAGGEPCACAKMSSTTRKQLLHLKQEFELEKKRKEEAYIMADAFRIAFEQQLKRRNDQTLKLSDVDKMFRKETRRLNNWKLIKEDGTLFAKGSKESLGKKLMGMLISAADYRKLEELDDPQEIIKILIDLLNDKEEALAHQRKVSYMLSRFMEEKVNNTKSSNETGPSGGCSTVSNPHLESSESKGPFALTCCCLHKTLPGMSFCTAQSTNRVRKSLRTLKKSYSLPSRIIFCSEVDVPKNSHIFSGCDHEKHSKEAELCRAEDEPKLNS
ncbi:coiled-coil domain-containing protein 125 isoform X2 [Ambystoma mexicanum]|uniref:coiled-coil domain-containing protein 125 isoform X2 n=1 Tax=Ambystoma mexicanum TaxID=8296 RepID=UPI0037E82D2A